MAVTPVQEAGLNAAGAVAGALVGSGAVMELRFRDGRRALIRCGRSELTMLTAAYGNQPATAV